MLDHVVRAAARVPWAIMPDKLEEIIALINLRASGGHVDPDIIAQYAAIQTPTASQNGGVAVIPVYGVISQRMNLMAAASGGTSTEQLAQSIRQAVADPSISAIVLSFDSPGGSVFGVEELAREIRAARTTKPIVSVGNPLMASAAYWLGSQGSEIVGAPSGLVGSIGVLAMHVDHSAANEMQGVRPTIISAGKYKAEGSPDFPLSDEARAYLQDRADQYYGMFVDAVAAGRGVTADAVRNGYGEGRVLTSADALKAGMIDRVATLEETVQRLLQPQSRAALMRRQRVVAEEPVVVMNSGSIVGSPEEIAQAITEAIEKTPPVQAESTEGGHMADENQTTNTEPTPTPPNPAPNPTPEPAPTGRQQGDAPVAMAERFTAVEAENAQLKAMLEQQGTQLQSQAADLKAMQTERLQKKYTDEVRGRSDANSVAWAGDIEGNVKHLMLLAEHFGEDSEAVAFEVARGRATAAQIRTGDLYKAAGSDRSGGPMTAAQEMEKIAHEKVKNGEQADYTKALAAVQSERPDLFQRNREEVGVAR